MEEYKWVIRRTPEGFYTLTGYVLVNDKWSPDGAPLTWSYSDAVLESIRKHIAQQVKDNARIKQS